jgi:hypothetical protein
LARTERCEAPHAGSYDLGAPGDELTRRGPRQPAAVDAGDRADLPDVPLVAVVRPPCGCTDRDSSRPGHLATVARGDPSAQGGDMWSGIMGVESAA